MRELELKPDEKQLPDSDKITALVKLLPKDGERWKKVQDLGHDSEMKQGRSDFGCKHAKQMYDVIREIMRRLGGVFRNRSLEKNNS